MCEHMVYVCVYIYMCIHIFKLLFCLVVIVWYSFLLPTTASWHTHEQIFGVNHISLPPPELNFHSKNGIWYQGRGLSPLKLLLQSVFLYPLLPRVDYKLCTMHSQNYVIFKKCLLDREIMKATQNHLPLDSMP